MTHKDRKKVKKFHVLRTEILYGSLDVLFGGLRISKLQFLIKIGKKSVFRKFRIRIFFQSKFKAGRIRLQNKGFGSTTLINYSTMIKL